MYKVAFPGATEEDERREMDWVRSKMGKGEAVLIAGQVIL